MILGSASQGVSYPSGFPSKNRMTPTLSELSTPNTRRLPNVFRVPILSSRLLLEDTISGDLATLSVRHDIHIFVERFCRADSRHVGVVVQAPCIVACAGIRHVVPALFIQVVRLTSRGVRRRLIRRGLTHHVFLLAG